MAELEKLLCTDSKVESLKKINAIIENSGSGLQLFDTVLKDHVLTYEETKGLALQGTYVYKEALAGSRYGYSDFYNKVIDEYNGATQTETINGVTVKVNANGHKFYDIADKTAIDEFYNSLGLAWFYGVDTENERIFLPRDKYFAIKGKVGVAGNGMGIGLTDGITNAGWTAYNAQANGPMWVADAYGQPVGTITSGTGVFEEKYTIGITTDPTKSGIEAHLQANEEKYLYICVGNTTNYEGVTDVVNQGMEILEQVNQGIESRVKLDGSNAEFPYITQTYVNGTSGYNIYSNGYCEQWGQSAVATATTQITLLKTFANTDYNISLGGSSAGYAFIVSRTINSFVADTSANATVDWRAYGYLAEGEY